MTLKECKTREDIENVFMEQKISPDDFEAKNNMLLEVMGNPRMFYSIGNPTPAQKHELIVASFLSEKWKYAVVMKQAMKDHEKV